MTLLSILDVAVGLILVWLILSLVVMQIQEWIAGRYHLRSKMLADTIENMLGARLTRQFYEHPIIRSLSAHKNSAALPSYIPSDQFGAVLLDLIRSLGQPAACLREQLFDLCSLLEGRRQSKARRAAIPRLRDLLGLLDSGAQGSQRAPAPEMETQWMLAELQKIGAEFPAIAADLQAIDSAHREVRDAAARESTPDSTNGRILAEVRAGLAALGALDPAISRSLRVVCSSLDQHADHPENALVLARRSIQSWFESAMERLTGRYKRRAVTLSFLIGFCLAAFLNVDTVLLAGFLWRQAYVAAAIANEAQSLFSNSVSQLSQLSAGGQLLLFQSRFSIYNVPLGWISLPIEPDAALSLTQLRQMCTLSSSGVSGIQGFFLANRCFPIVNAPHLTDYLGWGLKLMGCVITAAAAAQGAPFWFDILAKLVNVRSSGMRPAPATERVG